MVVAGEMLHDYSDDEICSDISRSSGLSEIGRVYDAFVLSYAAVASPHKRMYDESVL